MFNAISVNTQNVEHADAKKEENDEEMTAEWATRCRRIHARANYLSQDRSDIGYAVKESRRRMS